MNEQQKSQKFKTWNEDAVINDENKFKKWFRMNTYGSIMSDLTQPFAYRTSRDQYEHDNACAQDTKNMLQMNRRDIHLPDPALVDLESELRNQTRYYDRTPESRYLGNCKANQDKNVPVCTNLPTIDKKCEKKIVTSYYYDGPTKNYGKA